MIINGFDFSKYSLWQANKILRDNEFTCAEKGQLSKYYTERHGKTVVLATVIDGRNGFYTKQLREVPHLIEKS